MTKVSIITPVYNRPEFLIEAVLSVQQQTFVDWEHIIVNDGATNEDTANILSKISAYPKTLIFNKKNEGLGAARNYGIARAGGEFILTLDDDDKWSSNFIEKALEIFKYNDSTGAVTSWMQEFGARNSIIKPLGGNVKNFLAHNNSVHGMFKKADWLKVGKYDESYFFQPYTDWDFWLRLTASGKEIKVIPELFFHYRTHKDKSMLKDSEKNHIDLFKYLIEKNKSIYCEHILYVLCDFEERLKLAKKNSSAKTLLIKFLYKFKLLKNV